MIDPTQPLVLESEKQENNKTMPATGFHTNPERINRNGRPKKGYSVTEHVKDLLENDPTTMQDIVNKISQAAKQGDIAAIKIIWQYMDGMPMQPTEVKHDGALEIVTHRAPTKK